MRCCADYAAESAIAVLPVPKAEWLTYARMEHHGALHVIGAYIDGQLVGFCSNAVSLSPHCSVLIAVTESLFVSPSHRSTGAGLACFTRGRERGPRTWRCGDVGQRAHRRHLGGCARAEGFRENEPRLLSGGCNDRAGDNRPQPASHAARRDGAVRALEAQVQALPQVQIPTDHVIHAGLYARTIRIPVDVILTGAGSPAPRS